MGSRWPHNHTPVPHQELGFSHYRHALRRRNGATSFG
nr:MAG TPA: hypothetical protein [Caudoviricetes sp.]